jgi:hypothetical protein
MGGTLCAGDFPQSTPSATSPYEQIGQAELVQSTSARENQAQGANERTVTSPSRNLNANRKLASFPPKVDFEEVLPKWAYSDEVAKLAKGEFKGKIVPMGVCVGPGVLDARKSAIIGWGTLGIMTLAAYHTAKCSEDGFVYYPLQLWLVYLPVIIWKQYLQFQCLKYVSIPLIQVVGASKVCGSYRLSYLVWFVAMMILSIASTMDYATDSFFMAVILRAKECDDKLEIVWAKTLDQSPFFHYFNVSFEVLAYISYGLMIAQPVYAMLNGIPACGEEAPDYKVGVKNTEKDEDYKLEFKTTVDTCYGTTQNMGDALFGFAEIADMICIQSVGTDFPMNKANMVWEDKSNSEDIVIRCQRMLRFNRNALSRAFARVGLVTLAENTYQVTLQVSMLALFEYMKKGAPAESSFADMFYYVTHDDGTGKSALLNLQFQTLCSIALSIFMAGIRFFEVFFVFYFSWLTHKRVSSVIEDKKNSPRAASDEAVGEQPMTNEGIAELQRSLKDVRISVLGLLVLMIIYVVFTAWALAKLVYVYRCKDSLWNVSGCVELG